MANLLQYRGQIAKELGAFVAANATSGSTSTLVDTFSLRSTTRSTLYYDDWYIYRPGGTSGDQVARRVASYDPITGTLTPDSVWTNAVTAGEYYELHGFIEPYADMTDVINLALKRCWITTEGTLTPIALATRHSLANLTGIGGATQIGQGLLEDWQVRAVGTLASGEDREQVNPYFRTVRGWVSNEGGTFYLNHPGYSFNTTDTLYVQLVIGAYYLCRASGGTYGERVRLSSDTQEAPVPIEWLTPGALIEAFNRFDNILDKTSNQRLQSDEAKVAARFTTQCRQNFRLPALTFQPLVPLGPLPLGCPYPRSS